jgi:hypothetical protein
MATAIKIGTTGEEPPPSLDADEAGETARAGWLV